MKVFFSFTADANLDETCDEEGRDERFIDQYNATVTEYEQQFGDRQLPCYLHQMQLVEHVCAKSTRNCGLLEDSEGVGEESER